MSDEKKEIKCCGCCKGANKELSNEDLDKVAGGSGWKDGKYICTNPIRFNHECQKAKTVDNVSNVCTCNRRTSGECCKEYGDNCSCWYWDKKSHRCLNGD